MVVTWLWFTILLPHEEIQCKIRAARNGPRIWFHMSRLTHQLPQHCRHASQCHRSGTSPYPRAYRAARLSLERLYMWIIQNPGVGCQRRAPVNASCSIIVHLCGCVKCLQIRDIVAEGRVGFPPDVACTQKRSPAYSGNPMGLILPDHASTQRAPGPVVKSGISGVGLMGLMHAWWLASFFCFDIPIDARREAEWTSVMSEGGWGWRRPW